MRWCKHYDRDVGVLGLTGLTGLTDVGVLKSVCTSVARRVNPISLTAARRISQREPCGQSVFFRGPDFGWPKN